MRSFSVTGFLFLAVPILCASASAAQTQRTKLFRRAPAPTREVHLDLATGAYVRGPIARSRAGTTVADFQNLDVFDGAGVGWVSADTGGGTCRWFSNAAKGAAANQSHNASDLMTDIVFFYCSAALDPASGGAGGSATIGFYEGYTVFGGAATTAAAVVALTEMPANPVASSFFGSVRCTSLHVSFPVLVAFADDVFMGYSWQFEDVGTDTIVAATFPYLACVVSCSGLNIGTQGTAGGVGGNPLAMGEDGQGMLDVIDQFCTTAGQTTFTFGTIGPAWAPSTRTSINMQVQEASDLATTNVNYNASSTPNADTLSATKAILGSSWTATLTRAVVSAQGGLLVTVRRSRTPLSNGTMPPLPVSGRVLVAGTLLSTVPGAHDGTTGSVSASVPPILAFVGLHFAAQCRTSGGGLELSSAVEGTVGTF